MLQIWSATLHKLLNEVTKYLESVHSGILLQLGFQWKWAASKQKVVAEESDETVDCGISVTASYSVYRDFRNKPPYSTTKHYD
jgi:hypothetical protein